MEVAIALFILSDSQKPLFGIKFWLVRKFYSWFIIGGTIVTAHQSIFDVHKSVVCTGKRSSVTRRYTFNFAGTSPSTLLFAFFLFAPDSSLHLTTSASPMPFLRGIVHGGDIEGITIIISRTGCWMEHKQAPGEDLSGAY